MNQCVTYQFNQNFFKCNKLEIIYFFKSEKLLDIAWFDKEGVIKLNKDTNATVTLYSANNTMYSGYLVNIVNKHTGVIDGHLFKFDDYLKNRVDERNDYDGGFCVEINSCKWYVALPSEQDINDMCVEIMSYIDLWR
jgi:hypothetical protein